MLKNTANMKEIIHRENSAAISCQVSHASLLYVSADICRRDLVDESGMIRNMMSTQNKAQVVAVQGSPCTPTP
jgi:hypothetical protein